jgi:hypothetical protein
MQQILTLCRLKSTGEIESIEDGKLGKSTYIRNISGNQVDSPDEKIRRSKISYLARLKSNTKDS